MQYIALNMKIMDVSGEPSSNGRVYMMTYGDLLSRLKSWDEQYLVWELLKTPRKSVGVGQVHCDKMK